MKQSSASSAMLRRPLAVLCLGILAVSFAPDVTAAVSGEQFTEIFRLNKFKGTDFVFDLDGEKPPANDVGGGTVKPLNVAQLPVLQGLGVSFALLELAPCGINPAHIHPRATELLYVIEGEKVQTGLVLENGAVIKDIILNELSKGEVAVFPEGQVHFQQNLDCKPAKLIAALSSEDPGVLPIAPALFKLPSDPLSSILGLDNYSVEDLKKGIPSDAILKGSQECLKKCGGYTPSYTPPAQKYTPAPTYTPSPTYTPAPQKYSSPPAKY